MAEMICGMISGNSRKARTISPSRDVIRHKPMAHSVPSVVASTDVDTAMMPLCAKLDSHSGLVNRFSKWRSENSPLGIDRNRLGVSDTGIAISAGNTRNSSATHAPTRLNRANSPGFIVSRLRQRQC